MLNYIPCRRICTNKTNVPADLNGLLSTAKNLPELNKGFAIRLLHIANLYV